MARQNWKLVKDIFVQALEQKEEVRQEFLENACDDKNVLREVNSLLASYDSAESFMEIPVGVDFGKTKKLENPQLTSGQNIKHYKIVEQIGKGGMGEVYRAKDTKLKRNVALKLLPAEFIDSKDFLRRFEQEAFAASSLNHPNILTIYEIGKTEDTNFIATEFIEGETLREKLRNKSIELLEVLNIAVQATSALVTAHKAGIVHRDIKPENIMIREDGIVKILDFGLAKPIQIKTLEINTEEKTKPQVNTKSGVIMGTPQYMSPEQARSKTVDGRTDIWSLGVVFYEMITGKSPFAEETASDTIAAILKGEPKSFSQNDADALSKFEKIVKKCLKKNHQKRYQTTNDLLTDLEELKQDLEFEAKLEQSVQPNTIKFDENKGEKTAIIKDRDSVEQIGTTAEQRNISSAEYITQSVKRNKFAVFGVLATLIISAITLSFYFFSNSTTPRPLTDKDVILLADFENKTDEDIFDGTLKQGLWMQLRQSPFLSIFPDEQARKTLVLMKREKEERITRQLAKEICQRKGLRAYIIGTISKLGTAYVLTLESVNSVNGEKFAITQAEAENKEKILQALSQASKEMRTKLGESLATIEKFDKPLEATTNSLEALKAYSDGNELFISGKQFESLPYYKRAIELDPKFAMAYLRIAGNYATNGKYELGKEALRKAFELRNHTSEREKVLIENSYYGSIPRDLNKSKEILEIAKRNYPRDAVIRAWLGSNYLILGKLDAAYTEFEEAKRILNEVNSPDSSTLPVSPIFQMGMIKLMQGDTNKAREFMNKSGTRNTIAGHAWRFSLAFVEGNEEELNEVIKSIENLDGESNGFLYQAHAAAFYGKWKTSEQFFKKAVALAKKKNNQENVILYSVAYASWATVMGDCSMTKILETSPLDYYMRVYPPTFTPLGLARCSKFAEAEKQINKFKEKYPNGTLENGLWIPMFKAQIELEKGNPKEAVKLMENAKEYEWAFGSWLQPQYILARAYLESGENEKAKAEFQKILDNRGVSPLGVVYPLAQLGKARAMKDKREYEKFFESWKDADEDLEILLEAKKEHENLR